MKTKLFIIFLFLVNLLAAGCVQKSQVPWKHLSSANSGYGLHESRIADQDGDGDK